MTDKNLYKNCRPAVSQNYFLLQFDYFICGLFNGAISITHYVTSKQADLMDNKLKSMKSSHGLIWGTIPALAGRDWGKSQKAVKIAGVSAEIRSGRLLIQLVGVFS
jgi:hypothetical protein